MDERFKVHMLNEDGKKAAAVIADLFDTLLLEISKVCQQGRELEITKTKLEEACFFAKKAMAKKTGMHSS